MAENRYKDTVNLPVTDFPIRASLQEREPYWLQQWPTLTSPESDAAGFVLHDGPPYPNGNIHMGHALNKVLKDIIVRYQRMSGGVAPYVPGWDCHGLPIEVQVLKESGVTDQAVIKADIAAFRTTCELFARRYVDTQRQDFQRLGIHAVWDRPYLTLNPSYEAAVLTSFARMADNGIVYQGRKPIHWCMTCQTALAEAEIEHADHRSPSVYVAFRVAETALHLPAGTSVAVWTTTPWTLPANVAVAAHPELVYHLLKVSLGDPKGDSPLKSLSSVEIGEADFHVLVVSTLVEKVATTCGWEILAEVATFTGADLANTRVKHPFLDKTVPVVLADYVSDADGTGFVHIAPGHGQEDYQVGQTCGLPTLMPVENDGRFAADTPLVAGQAVFDANKTIGQAMSDAGTLFKLQFIKHSYPHCWRCKNPVIFRATKQWFVAMDKPVAQTGKTLRELALASIGETTFIPTWGANRLQAMIENRPDWCISRQRFWGIPIPVFYCKACREPHMTGVFHEAVVALVSAKGSGAWFSQSPETILPAGTACHCGHTVFEKETDILDVWFESGASFAGVLTDEYGLRRPADLYLEGSDQHRGWFQSSMLIGLGAYQQAPFKAILTHGFLVDDKGRKMSKSMGNVISPEEIIREYGADILRWWVANSDFKLDIAIAKGIINQARDTFSKVRNTIRFCLSNLHDFDVTTDAVAIADVDVMDRWALSIHNTLVRETQLAFDKYDFHTAVQKIHEACAVSLSAGYLDMVKDRLYCDGAGSATRRSTQTVMFYLADTLIRLIAPVLVFTSEEAYSHLRKPGKQDTVHREAFPVPIVFENEDGHRETLAQVLRIRDKVYQELEGWRKAKTIKSFLETKLALSVPSALADLDWESILIVSQVTVTVSETESLVIALAEGEKCERCWKVKQLADGLCGRCVEALSV